MSDEIKKEQSQAHCQITENVIKAMEEYSQAVQQRKTHIELEFWKQIAENNLHTVELQKDYINSMESRIEELSFSNKLKADQLEEYTSEIDSLTALIKTLEKTNDELHERVTDQSDELASFIASNEELRNENTALQSEIDNLKRQMHKYEFNPNHKAKEEE